MKPLLYLETRLLINSVKNVARSPKRLIPALIIGAWMISWLLQWVLVLSGEMGRQKGPDLGIIHGIPVELAEAALFVLVSIGSVAVMYGAFNSGLMIFSLPQIDFLFPTPIRRRDVLLMKLLMDYARYGLYVIFFFLVLAPPLFGAIGVSMFPWGLMGVGAMAALAILVVNLAHTLNIVFTFGFERLRHAGAVIKAVLIGAPTTAVLYGLVQFVRTGSSYTSVLLAADSPVLRAVFAPASWCAALILAPLIGVTSDGWLHLAALWALAGASFLLVLSRKENIYEPSLGVSVRFARRRRGIQSGDYTMARIDALREKGVRRMDGPSIPPFGHGAAALVWKNLILRYRTSRWQLAPILILCAVVIYSIKYVVDDSPYLAIIPLYAVWIFSLMALNEMRSELKQANIIKAMPIAPWKVIFAQAVSSVAQVTAGIVLFTALMWVLLPSTRNELLLACLIVAPFVAFAGVSMMFVSGLLYPETRDSTQNYLNGMIGSLLGMMVFAPTIILGGLFVRILHEPMYVSVAVVCAANLMMGAAGVSVAGALFRRFDPTSE